MLVRRVPPDACTLSGELDTPDQPLLLAQLSPLHAALSESQKKMLLFSHYERTLLGSTVRISKRIPIAAGETRLFGYFTVAHCAENQNM